MRERAFDAKAFFTKRCELPVLAFSLREMGPNEDICIRLPTVAVPEQRLDPANGHVGVPTRLPTLLFVLQ